MVSAIPIRPSWKNSTFLLLVFLSLFSVLFAINYYNSTSTESFSSALQFTEAEEDMTALEIIEQNCKGSIHQEFPDDFWNKKIKEIKKLA